MIFYQISPIWLALNYCVKFNEKDTVFISTVNERLAKKPEVKKYMNRHKTEENRQILFKEQFDDVVVDYANERFDFYKKMYDNPSVNNLVFKMLLSDYQKQHMTQDASE